jgi:hypothetical protein
MPGEWLDQRPDAAEILDQWLDHDEGVRVIQTARGFYYEPIRKRGCKRDNDPLHNR